MAANGDFVVVWQDRRNWHYSEVAHEDVGTYQIFARRFSADGSGDQPEFLVSSAGTNHDQTNPDVSTNCKGDFFITWEESTGSTSRVRLRGFSADGTALLSDRVISPDDNEVHVGPAVGVSPCDRYLVVTWQSGRIDTREAHPVHAEIDDYHWHGDSKLLMRGFELDGVPRFGPSQVDLTSPTALEYNPSVGVKGTGEFVIAWDNIYADVRAATFHSGGQQYAGPLMVCREIGAHCARPRVAVSEVGDFTVVWEDDLDRNGRYQIRKAMFSLDGTRMTYATTVNEVAAGNQYSPDIGRYRASSAALIVWEDDSNKNGVFQIKVRGVAESAVEADFGTKTVNSDPHGNQMRPSIAFRPTLKQLLK